VDFMLCHALGALGNIYLTDTANTRFLADLAFFGG